MRNGNKFQEEVIFAGAGELPIRFSLFYNSKHYTTASSPNSIVGQWTHSYSTHLLFDPLALGAGGAMVEIRMESGQSLYFVEPSTPGVAYFTSNEAGEYGFFRTTGYDAANQAYTGFQYEALDKTIHSFDADGLLTRVENRQAVSVDLTRTATSGVTTVTVTGAIGESLAFTHDEAAGSPDDLCFRCPTSVVTPDGHQYTINQNAKGLVGSIDYPEDPTDPISSGVPNSRVFLYDKTEANTVDGCTNEWDCTTALTGIIDEEGRRWATWDYRGHLKLHEGSENFEHKAWAYESFHGGGPGEDAEDHVEFSQLAQDTFEFRVNFVATRRHGVQDVYRMEHFDAENNAIAPRMKSLRDARDYNNVLSVPLNDPVGVEPGSVRYIFYPASAGFQDKLVSRIKVRDSVGRDAAGNVTTGGESIDRSETDFEYYKDEDGNGVADQLIKRKTEKSGGASTQVIVRVTDYVWDYAVRKPKCIVVSSGGVVFSTDPAVLAVNPCAFSGTGAEYEIARVYSGGRIQSEKLTDHTAPPTPAIPEVFAGRTRETIYSYTFHGGYPNRVLTMTVDGPRGAGAYISESVNDAVEVEFTLEGFVTRVKDAAGNETKFTNFTERGQPKNRELPDGTSTSYAYSPRGWLRSVTNDQTGDVITYEYYANGMLEKVDFPDGAVPGGNGDVVYFEYNNARKPKVIFSSHGDRVDFARSHALDGSGLLTIDATFSENATLGAPGVTVATSTVIRDSRDRLYETRGPDGQVTRYKYSQKRRLVSVEQEGFVTDPATDPPTSATLETEYAYDGLGRITGATHPDAAGAGANVIFTHDLRDQITSITEGSGLLTEYITDGFGDVLRVVSPESGTTDYGYDPAGNLRRVLQNLGDGVTATRLRDYDAANRLLTETVSPGGLVRSWEYDAADASLLVNRKGRLSKVTDETGVTEYGYDNFGRPNMVNREIMNSNGVPVSLNLEYGYDAVGRPIFLKYPSGRTVDFRRIEGRIDSVEMTPAVETITNLATGVDYFPFQGIDGFTFGNGLVLDRGRDSSQRLNSYTLSDPTPTGGGSPVTIVDRSYDYDAFSNVFQMFDNLVDPANAWQEFGYDERQQLTFADGPYGEFVYGYDDSGNRATRTLTRDGAGAVPAVDTYHVGHTIDSGGGALASVPSNRLSSVDIDDPDMGISFTRELNYDTRGNLEDDLRSGADKLRFEYDDRSRVKEVLRKVVPEPGFSSTIGLGICLLSLLSSRRGRRTFLGSGSERGGGGTAIVLLSLTVVVFSTLGSGNAWAQADFDEDGIPDAFEMASVGHPTNIPLDYMNEVDATLDYDQDTFDNVTEYLAGTDLWDPCDSPNPVPHVREIKFDVELLVESGDVMVSWVTECASWIGVDSGQMQHIPAVGDGTGQHTFTGITESTTFFVVANNASGTASMSRELELYTAVSGSAYNAQNQRVRNVVDGGAAADEERLFVYGLDGRILAEVDAAGLPLVEYIYIEGEALAQVHTDSVGVEEVKFVHNDHIGTAEFLTDASRAVAWEFTPSPFGEGVVNPSQDVTQNTRFSGQYADANSGLSYNWHRYYDPSLGRYISVDPIGQAGGVNVYAYAGNNPTNYVDPLGLFRFGKRPIRGGGARAAIGAVSNNPVSDYTNTEYRHEQGFFEDGSGENIGFGPGGRFAEGEPENLGYQFDDAHYDDALMRRALENTLDGGPYGHLANNCQDWADRLRAEYNELLGETGGESNPGLGPIMTPAPPPAPNMSYGP